MFFDCNPDPLLLGFLVLALMVALAYEFVNGFHDTANAVATVIYTKSLKPWPAVVYSGLLNFLGVLFSGVGVAYAIVNLFPHSVLDSMGTGGDGFAAVFGVLVGAIVWNLGTWYLGIPASSSHTLIGSITGVGLAYSWVTAGMTFGQGVQWSKVKGIVLALFFSPALGFFAAALLLVVLKSAFKNPALYRSPEGDNPPPWWIRGLLIVTCGGVSFAHGSNDGQKGMGLIMLILIGIVPGAFALNLMAPKAQWESIPGYSVVAASALHQPTVTPPSLELSVGRLEAFLEDRRYDPIVPEALSVVVGELGNRLRVSSLQDIAAEERFQTRILCVLIYRTWGESVFQSHQSLTSEQRQALGLVAAQAEHLSKYVSPWVKLAVAVALGLGTMIGWKRVVVTVGEKIGKEHLSYGQGASAEAVAALTILAADHFHMPVSTTHILSSGVAGTMYVHGSGLQRRTVLTLLSAWVLTLPVSMLLGAGSFLVIRWMV